MQVNAGLESPVSINLQLWKELNKCCITLGPFSSKVSKLTLSLKTLHHSSLQFFGVTKWSSSSYPETSFTHTPSNDFSSRTDAALELPALINSCLHSGSINTQPFEGNCIGWFNYGNPITFTSFSHSNVSLMETIRKILIRLKYRPAMQ